MTAEDHPSFSTGRQVMDETIAARRESELLAPALEELARGLGEEALRDIGGYPVVPDPEAIADAAPPLTGPELVRHENPWLRSVGNREKPIVDTNMVRRFLHGRNRQGN
jgi:hypothetical protein